MREWQAYDVWLRMHMTANPEDYNSGIQLNERIWRESRISVRDNSRVFFQ